MTTPIDRRTFIKGMAAGGGTLLLGLWVGACTRGGTATTTAPGSSTTSTMGSTTTTEAAGDPSVHFDPHLLLRIGGDGAVTVTVPKSELGQGVRTSLAMILAEELDADWSQVVVETAPADRSYGDQVTGGSQSVSSRYDSMRLIGAAARHMLIAAAAGRWGVDPDMCGTEPGAVVEMDGGRRAGYGLLAGLAADVDAPSPAELVLKDPAEYRIIGRPQTSIDAPRIATGAAVYGSDVRVSGMVYGAIARPPVFGARVASWDDAAARAVPGVVDVVETSAGVAVVAENTWAALVARDVLTVAWDAQGSDSVDGRAIMEELRARLDPPELGAGEMTADYTFPYNAHAAMETLTCLADARTDRCEVWAGSQDPQLARAVAARGSNLPTDQVTLHVPMIGGGFGRRLEQGFVEDAVELSAAIRRPVRLFWTRADDLRHDRFHPAGACRAVGDPADPSTVRVQVASARDGPVPTGDWRSVSNAPEAFARESFIDELAHAAGADPYEYRRSILADRALATLDAAAAAAGWGTPLPAGRGRGIAHHTTWRVTPTTVVAEVTVEDGRIGVDRVVCAVDCGTVVNPDTVVAQIEGAVAFGTTAALLGGVTIASGSVVEEAFHDAPILRFDEMPDVETVIVPSTAVPSGIGEAGVPPMAPAIANAVFAASGRRLRDLPLTLS